MLKYSKRYILIHINKFIIWTDDYTFTMTLAEGTEYFQAYLITRLFYLYLIEKTNCIFGTVSVLWRCVVYFYRDDVFVSQCTCMLLLSNILKRILNDFKMQDIYIEINNQFSFVIIQCIWVKAIILICLNQYTF